MDILEKFAHAELAARIVETLKHTEKAFEKYNPDTLVPLVAKMLVKGSVLNLPIERNAIENLVDILQEALCYHEDGVPD